jgi:WD40 repeat protein
VTRIWNGASGQQTHGFYLETDGAGNGVALNALAFQPGGNMLAIGGMDGVVRLRQNGLTCQTMGQGATQGQCLDMPQRLTAHTKPLRALAWSPDGRFLATGGDDNMLNIWYPAQSQTPLLKIPQDAPVLALNWSPNGKTIAAAAGKTVTLWALS